MQITIQQVLNKIESELLLAKQSTDEHIWKEKLNTIKVLAELALENDSYSVQVQTRLSLAESSIEEEEILQKNTSLLDF